MSKLKKASYSCIVCKSNPITHPDLRYHLFPLKGQEFISLENEKGIVEKVDVLDLWARKLEISLNSISKYSKVCSKHFCIGDYKNSDSKRSHLLRYAVPSLALSVSASFVQNPEKDHSYVKHANNLLTQQSLKRKGLSIIMDSNVKKKRFENEHLVDLEQNLRQHAFSEHTAPNNFEIYKDYSFFLEPDGSLNSQVSCSGNFEEPTNKSNSENVSVDDSSTPLQILNLLKVKLDLNDLQTSKLFDLLEKKLSTEKIDSSVQVSNEESCSIINMINTDSKLCTMTGIQSFKVLDIIVKIASRAAKSSTSSSKLGLREKIIMTYLKLKQNLSYAVLSVIFNTWTRQHCQVIFIDTVQLLSSVLRVFIRWPSKEEIRKNLPLCFEHFMNVRLVLDCTEIFIQQPSNLTQQIVTYSFYKHGNTLKIMTGVCPAGDIVWISSTYGGRFSDKAIFENSNLTKLLDPGDAIMVDRGFLIEDVCDIYRIKIVRPPFLGERKQLTANEARLTAKIASARIHIERSNQRLKVFKILGDTLPSCLIPVFEDIFTVIAATINLSSPILKDDKFFK